MGRRSPSARMLVIGSGKLRGACPEVLQKHGYGWSPELSSASDTIFVELLKHGAIASTCCPPALKLQLKLQPVHRIGTGRHLIHDLRCPRDVHWNGARTEPERHMEQPTSKAAFHTGVFCAQQSVIMWRQTAQNQTCTELQRDGNAAPCEASRTPGVRVPGPFRLSSTTLAACKAVAARESIWPGRSRPAFPSVAQHLRR